MKVSDWIIKLILMCGRPWPAGQVAVSLDAFEDGAPNPTPRLATSILAPGYNVARMPTLPTATHTFTSSSGFFRQ
jgi:hypothetical protein